MKSFTTRSAALGLLLALASLTAIPGCWSRSGRLGNAAFERDDPDPDFELPQVGDGLEFRIIANDMDDREAIVEATVTIDNARFDAGLKAELADLQAKGLPPPGPRGPDKTPKQFVPANQKTKRTYSWVELGPQERVALELANKLRVIPPPENGEIDRLPNRGDAWTQMETARIQERATQLNGPGHRKLMQGALFYSRPCTNRNLNEEQRQKKQLDYFILTRNPAIDENGTLVAKGKPRAVTGHHLSNVYSAPGFAGHPTIHFNFNETGGKLMRNLTESNLPDGENRRHLAMIFHGMIVSAPTVNSAIDRQGQITGNFTRREVENMVNVLRAGMGQE